MCIVCYYYIYIYIYIYIYTVCVLYGMMHLYVTNEGSPLMTTQAQEGGIERHRLSKIGSGGVQCPQTVSNRNNVRL